MSAKSTRKGSPKPAADTAASAAVKPQPAAEAAAPPAQKLEGTSAKPRPPAQSTPSAATARPSQRGEQDGRIRAVIDRVMPEVDCGRFAVKRVLGDTMNVEAHVFTDGHDTLAVMLRYRHEDESDWREAPMALRYNDEWLASFP